MKANISFTIFSRIMNASLLISSIQANNDLATIAQMSNLSLDELKSTLVNLLDPSGDLRVSTESPDKAGVSSLDELDSDEEGEDDMFERILKHSKVPLSDEQINFIRLAAKKRKNLALLSAAGYGKSATLETLLKAFRVVLQPPSVKFLEKRYGQFVDADTLRLAGNYGICASTGKAASLINARTLHSYFGIGLARGRPSEWVARVSTAKYLKSIYNHLRVVQVIVIDEISMVSAQLLDKISEYMQLLRRCGLPFGGCQMIFVGDASQLPPVQGSYFFQSKAYNEARVQQYQLTKCFRQVDPAFQNILNELRTGDLSDESFAILKAQTTIDPKLESLKPMNIVSTNAEVDSINDRELKALLAETKAELHRFAVKSVSNKTAAERAMKSDGVPHEVQLAVGAQVVVTHNVSPPSVVNGTQGIITKITNSEIEIKTPRHEDPIAIGYVEMKDRETMDIYSAKTLLEYIPLRLGWASTVHKAQGASLDTIMVDAKRIWASGQLYVAISRVRSLEGLIVKNLSRKAIVCDKTVKAFIGAN